MAGHSCRLSLPKSMRVLQKKNGLLVLCLWWVLWVNAQSSAQYKILIIDGFSNHNWEQTTTLVKQFLEQSGLFKVSVFTLSGVNNDQEWENWEQSFAQFDAVIQNTNNVHDTALRWPKKMELALQKYVRSGGGLYILHSANNAFPHWAAYNRMIGLGWRKKEQGVALRLTNEGRIVKIKPGQGKDTYHGPRNDQVITILNRHPINRGMPKAWKTPNMELYKYARGPAKKLTLLSYAKDEKTGLNWPVEWVVRYGKGRVYNASTGHLWEGEVFPISYRCVGFQTTLIRATEWLAAGKTTYAIPLNFPTAENINLID